MSTDTARDRAIADIPVLETERLIMRAMRTEDAPALAAIHGDEETMRYIGGKASAPLSASVERILVYLGHWIEHGHGKWGVYEKASGRLVGRTGYLDLTYDWPGLELGWTFLRETWGKGYATESAIAARDWGFRTLGVDRILSMIHPENAASMAVARRVGETFYKPFAHPSGEQTLWSITRPEWAALV